MEILRTLIILGNKQSNIQINQTDRTKFTVIKERGLTKKVFLQEKLFFLKRMVFCLDVTDMKLYEVEIGYGKYI